jgi:hypothetical protein
MGKHILPELRQTIGTYALKTPLDAATLSLSQLDWNGVSVGAASLVLQDFLAGKIG